MLKLLSDVSRAAAVAVHGVFAREHIPIQPLTCNV